MLAAYHVGKILAQLPKFVAFCPLHRIARAKIDEESVSI
jgi:hypothetical protein